MQARHRTRLLATLSILVAATASVSACSDSTLVVAESRVASPDGHREATTSAVRQTSGGDAGASYTRVTIRETAAGPHANVPRVVLCTAGTARPRIRWIDDGHVLLSYDVGARLDCPSAVPPGLVVSYRAEAATASRSPAPGETTRSTGSN